MKRLTAVLAVAAIALVVCEQGLIAGPRGGRSGASRGGSTRSAPSRGGSTINTPSLGGSHSPSLNLNQSPSFNTPNTGSRTLELNSLNRSGSFSTDRLSGMLDGTFKDKQGSVSRDQLNSFLDLPTDTETGGIRQNATARESERNWKEGERSGEIYNDISNHWANQPQPFTAAWYAQHPQAWQYTHPHADAWAAATWGVVTGWVAGVATTPAGYTYSETVVYTDDAPENETVTEASQASEATQLATTPAPIDANAEWLPLGVFALVEGDSTSAQMMFQLSVSKSGHIGGSYFNVISGNSQPINGAINKQTQQAAWSVAGNDAVVFHSDLASLTTAEADVLIHYAGGETQRWTLVRLEGEQH